MPPSAATNQYPRPSGVAAIATIGWFRANAPADPKNGTPKANTPPLAAATQYPPDTAGSADRPTTGDALVGSGGADVDVVASPCGVVAGAAAARARVVAPATDAAAGTVPTTRPAPRATDPTTRCHVPAAVRRGEGWRRRRLEDRMVHTVSRPGPALQQRGRRRRAYSTVRAAGGLGAPVTLESLLEGPEGPTADSGWAMSSSDFRSASTPRNAATVPPRIITPAPMT